MEEISVCLPDAHWLTSSHRLCRPTKYEQQCGAGSRTGRSQLRRGSHVQHATHPALEVRVIRSSIAHTIPPRTGVELPQVVKLQLPLRSSGLVDEKDKACQNPSRPRSRRRDSTHQGAPGEAVEVSDWRSSAARATDHSLKRKIPLLSGMNSMSATNAPSVLQFQTPCVSPVLVFLALQKSVWGQKVSEDQQGEPEATVATHTNTLRAPANCSSPSNYRCRAAPGRQM